MAVSKTWNNTSRSIPESGDLNWADLSDFLVDLADNAQTTNFQKAGVRVALSSPVTVSATSDHTIVCELTVPGAVAVNLPAGASGQLFAVIDGTGDASTNNITITPAAGNINGSGTYVISRDRGGVMIQYDGTEWKVISEFVTGDDVISLSDARKITGTRAAPTAITAGGGISVSSVLREIIYIEGDGGAVDITADPQIAAPTGSFASGAWLTLIGRNDTNTVTLDHGTGLDLNGQFVMGAGDMIDLWFDGTNWFELGRRYT